jgi:hypothetical protein
LPQDRADLIGCQADRQDVAKLTLSNDRNTQSHQSLADCGLVGAKSSQDRLAGAQDGIEAVDVGYRPKRFTKWAQDVQYLLMIRLRQRRGFPERTVGNQPGRFLVEIIQVAMVKRGRVGKRVGNLHLTGNLAFNPVRCLRQSFGGRSASVAALLVSRDIGHPSAEQQNRNGRR